MWPQETHADLGLVDDDHTPDMRMAPVAADAIRNEQPTSTFRKEVQHS